MRKHGQHTYFVVGEGVLEFDRGGEARTRPPLADEELRRFRFSRLGPKGARTDEATRVALTEAITAGGAQPDSDPPIPAGFTYLGQFVDHDLTMDRTEAQLGDDVNLGDLVQGRSPALDLDSMYGRGPTDPHDRAFYADDGASLKVGRTSATTFPDDGVNVELEGFDLPRVGGSGGTMADRRRPLIPDLRNDENLAVAQTHLAFIRFHNRVVDELAMRGLYGRRLFTVARERVVRHYQWMLRTDFLPRIVDPAIVDDVFRCGRRFFETSRRGHHGQPPTMPLEFAVGAYRLGHSMVRGGYEWNRVFTSSGPGAAATLFQLFVFTGVAGNFDPEATLPDLDDPNSGTVLTLPTNWIADFRRLFDFTEAGRPDLAAPTGGGNVTKRIDTFMVDPLAELPAGTFGGRGTEVPAIHRNLAFRNLTRGSMVNLASGRQLAKFLEIEPLTEEQILAGSQGSTLEGLTDEQRAEVAEATPLWFYVLREAEFNGGRLGPVGGRVVAEVFHRAMEGSRTSIVREPWWRPSLGPDRRTFRMTDLLLYAFEGKADLLNPLGD
ncbi:peroxidase family protein [Actinophytocola gossypii]|uniref:Heme peroxidase n=1 Tax=Actinophytocola gossypii TaxID=2812003 RepID=A0ABT2J771_9PSEU|nr:heme peroxidase family protein [Actinophytocola gossypii]MCT2583459.1 heme peroxidase [Actinophytocola gossypii]